MRVGPVAREHRSDSSSADDRTDVVLTELEAEFELVLGRRERVERTLDDLRSARPAGTLARSPETLARFTRLLNRRPGALAEPIVDFLEAEARSAPDVVPVVVALAGSRAAAAGARAWDLALELVPPERWAAGSAWVDSLAVALEVHPTPTPTARLLRLRALLAEHAERRGAPADAIADAWFVDGSVALRRLAARLLDLPQALVTPERIARLLGEATARTLQPYVEFTRVGHFEFAEFATVPEVARRAADSIARAESSLGRTLLARVVGDLGWDRIALGISADWYTGIRLAAVGPLALRAAEARLLDDAPEATCLWERAVVVARGRTKALPSAAEERDERTVAMLRGYHLAHAEVLAELLAAAPLTGRRSTRIVRSMDRIVRDYRALFAARAQEVDLVGQVWSRLREEIVGRLDGPDSDVPLPASTSRIVQMFEDPRSPDEAHTLHGLKRYLHQRGLQAVFDLLPGGQSANRTVSIAVVSPRDVLLVTHPIRYADFESADPDDGDLPAPVASLVDAFSTHLLHGATRLPDVDILQYGNEVHVYAHFRNHPIFLRLDLSPPAAGGMIDLEGFLVSQYELDRHPDRSVPAIRDALRRLDFDVVLDGGRLHARYDKERAFELGDLLERASAVFRLLPRFMDLDWTVGGLDYPPPIRERVARDWTTRLFRTGALPIDRLVTADRRHLLQDPERSGSAMRAIAWNGVGGVPGAIPELGWSEAEQVVRAAYTRSDCASLFDRRGAPLVEQVPRPPVDRWLMPLRNALRTGEVVATTRGFVPAGPERFLSVDPVERFATLLDQGGDALHESARVAAVVAAVERHLRFHARGSVEQCAVEDATLALRDAIARVFVLRDRHGVARLAIATADDHLWRRRADDRSAWESEVDFDATSLLRLLRRDNYLGSGPDPTFARLDLADLIAELASPVSAPRLRAVGDEPFLEATVASPGRAVGLAQFGTRTAAPSDFAGRVACAATFGPEHATLIHHAAAVVATGGGVLSHAGLLALEARKPALVVPGRWQRDGTGKPVLVSPWTRFRQRARRVGRFRITTHSEEHTSELSLADGDLVVVDADHGVLEVLGKDPDTLALFLEMRRFAEATMDLRIARDDAASLMQRGRLLRAKHQLERILRRLDRPGHARFAARELLLDRPVSSRETSQATSPCPRDVARLLEVLLSNSRVRRTARSAARACHDELARRCDVLRARVRARILESEDAYEIAFLQQELGGHMARLRHVRDVLRASEIVVEGIDGDDLAALTRDRLRGLRARLRDEEADVPIKAAERWRLRHLRARARALDAALSSPEGEPPAVQELEGGSPPPRSRFVLGPSDGGAELRAIVGRKAANLGEVVRILGPAVVPPWFVFCDGALRRLLAEPVRRTDSVTESRAQRSQSLEDAIREILSRDEDAAAQALAVRRLWEGVAFPRTLEYEIERAYESLSFDAEPAFVAIRSSASEEDSEEGSWAGQFETFLYVRGLDAILDHLRLALAGLWSERVALHRRRLRVDTAFGGGGVIVQRMVTPRAAGVVHTVSAAPGAIGEMVVNVALGLGEGVVSGTVDVDEIHVVRSPDPDAPIRFRQIVGDKREQIVFDCRHGGGTRRVETLYHQRMRPALDYADLSELVRAATKLERVLGRPLDLEFAFEKDTLFILQVRPLEIFESALRAMAGRSQEQSRSSRSWNHDPS
ncbi:MAG: PEP/pyruvate-binding domain-containing protein [bacterium]